MIGCREGRRQNGQQELEPRSRRLDWEVYPRFGIQLSCVAAGV
jgi:hypothetical protein